MKMFSSTPDMKISQIKIVNKKTNEVQVLQEGEKEDKAIIQYNPRYSTSGEKQTDERKMNKGEPRVCRKKKIS